MKHLKDIMVESIFDDPKDITNKALWDVYFRDSLVADDTLDKISQELEKLQTKKIKKFDDDWNIVVYRGFYNMMTNGATQAISIGRNNEIYQVVWVTDGKKKSEVKCFRRTKLYISEPVYEIPEKLMWIVQVIKNCPNMAKL
jgi:hypothetical protein